MDGHLWPMVLLKIGGHVMISDYDELAMANIPELGSSFALIIAAISASFVIVVSRMYLLKKK